MLIAKYESFLIYGELEYNIFKFDGFCSISKSLFAYTRKCDSPTTSIDLKPSVDSLKYLSLGLGEYLLEIISFSLNWDQEEKLEILLRENKQAIGWTLR